MQKRVAEALFLFALLLGLVACGGAGGSQSGSTGGGTTSQNASTFVTADDFPLPAVLSFNVTISSVVLNGSSANTSNLLTQPVTLDFARLVGLRNLLAFGSVPAGTYTGMTIQLQSPVITAINAGTVPPTTTTLNGSWASGVSVANGVATVAVPLPNNLVISSTNMLGLHMHFDLRKSLQTDAAGQVTGVVNPQINANVVSAVDDDAVVTDLRGSIVSVDAAKGSFVVQTMGGKQVVINVNSQTVFNGSNTLATFTQGMVVEVQGAVQSDGSILADAVDVASMPHTAMEATIIYVDPNGKNITVLPVGASDAIPGITLENPVTLDISTVKEWTICGIDNWVTELIFDGNSLVAGQHVDIFGSIDTSVNPAAFVPLRIRLERQGMSGALVPNSVDPVSGNAGTFELQNTGMVGYMINGPLSVETTNTTKFFGVAGLAAMPNSGNMQVEIRGLLLKNPVTGTTGVYADWVKMF